MPLSIRLELLPMLAEVCAPFGVWGLTSLYHLWLLAARRDGEALIMGVASASRWRRSWPWAA